MCRRTTSFLPVFFTAAYLFSDNSKTLLFHFKNHCLGGGNVLWTLPEFSPIMWSRRSKKNIFARLFNRRPCQMYFNPPSQKVGVEWYSKSLNESLLAAINTPFVLLLLDSLIG